MLRATSHSHFLSHSDDVYQGEPSMIIWRVVVVVDILTIWCGPEFLQPVLLSTYISRQFTFIYCSCSSLLDWSRDIALQAYTPSHCSLMKNIHNIDLQSQLNAQKGIRCWATHCLPVEGVSQGVCDQQLLHPSLLPFLVRMCYYPPH